MGKYLSKWKEVKTGTDETLDYVRDIGHQYQKLADSVDGTVRRAGDVADSVNGSVRKAGDIAGTYAPLVKDGLDQSQKIVNGLQQVVSSANETACKIDNILSEVFAAMINLSTVFPILLIYASVFMLNLLQQMWFRSDILTEIFSYGYGVAITIALADSWHLFGQRHFRIVAAIFVIIYSGVMVVDHLNWLETSRQNDILIFFKLLVTASIFYAFYCLWSHPTTKYLLNQYTTKAKNTSNLLYQENINPEGSTEQNVSSGSNRTRSPVTESVHNNPVAASTPLQAASYATVEHEQITQEPQTNDRRHLNTPQRPPTPSMNTIESTSQQRLMNTSLSEPTSSCGSEAALSNVHTQQQNGTKDATSKKKKTKKEKRAEKVQHQEQDSHLLGNNPYESLSSND